MTQELLSEEQKASLRMLRAKYDTEYVNINSGDTRILQFNADKIIERKSEKFGTDQVVFDVVDPESPFTSHKLTMSSKRAIRTIMDNLLEGNNVLELKKTGEGNATRWFVQPV